MIDDYTPWNFKKDEETQEDLTEEVLRAFHRLRGEAYGIARKPHMSPDRKRIIFTTNDGNVVKRSDEGKLEKFEYNGHLYTVRATRPISPRKY